MLPRLLALACLSVGAVVGLKAVGASSAWWPAAPSAASLGLILATWASGAWLLVARLAPRKAEAALAVAGPKPVAPLLPRSRLSPRAAAPTGRASQERRAHPRFAVDWPVRAIWRGCGEMEGRLRDISEGGASLTAASPVSAGTEGLLMVEGIGLPVPARVVGWTPTTGLHVAFELDGLSLETFLAQLGRLLDRAAAEREGTGGDGPASHAP